MKTMDILFERFSGFCIGLVATASGYATVRCASDGAAWFAIAYFSLTLAMIAAFFLAGTRGKVEKD